ncbi:T9SS type A sorting domain-containing protein [Patescibacteria group bacterium]|nr:T9SS type A sorting domain-containing protein [Patescibacteria group bacterium]
MAYLKNVIYYQNVLIIPAAMNCDYLSNYQLSQLDKRFKEKLYLFTSQFFPNFNPQPTFQKTNFKSEVFKMKKTLLFVLFLLCTTFIFAQSDVWLWAKKAGGTSSENRLSIATDSSGNSYVIGGFWETASFGSIILESNGNADIFVAKAYIPYDSNDIVVVEGNTGLGAIYPNPFNPVANIPYNLSEISDADFYIYNVKGQLVRHINVGPQHPGYYQISWNGKDDNDKSCSSGIYYFIMKAGKQTFQRKAVLMK